MPQIWITYEELGDYTRKTASDARDLAIRNELPRRQCSDGQTRVKLPDDAHLDFMLRSIAESRVALDRLKTEMAETLRD